MFGKKSATHSAEAESRAVLAALDHTQAVVWFDLYGKILDANDNFLRTVGYQRDEIIGKYHSIFLEPDFVGSDEYEEFWNTLRSGKPAQGTFRRMARGDRAVWLEASYNPVLDPQGKPCKVVKFATDVTQSKMLAADAHGQLAAVSHIQAIIEFDMDGNILDANDNFLKATGYSLDDIKGRHHRIFMEKSAVASPDYAEFWAALNRGEFQDGEFRRIDKAGRLIWLHATYSPITGPDGKPMKVVKFARDITTERMKNADSRGQMAAISRSQAIIEFDLKGNILTANQNFCDALGYPLSEIQGNHHSLFVSAEDVKTPAYTEFWETLRRGEFHSGEFRRIMKGGKTIWIQASYNPIRDDDGNVIKVVKYASDITKAKHAITVVSDVLSKMSHGDLSLEITETFIPEYEQVRIDLNDAGRKLRQALSSVIEQVQSIQSQSDDINAASDDLSRRTEQQAATLEETAAAIDEMTSSIKSASDGASQAATVVREAQKNAETSGAVVRDAVQAMDEIAQGSNQISRITTVIEEIAFQTNLLALNAGVEAARAGEAGRGFAVVASEVRALAQRSSDAAREIAELISASSNQVKRGVGLVNQAGDALTAIESSIAEINQRVSDIATSSREQSAGLHEINIAVNQLDQVTQQNAAMFVQTSNATSILTDVASQLASTTAMFNVGATGGIPPDRRNNVDNWKAAS